MLFIRGWTTQGSPSAMVHQIRAVVPQHGVVMAGLLGRNVARSGQRRCLRTASGRNRRCRTTRCRRRRSMSALQPFALEILLMASCPHEDVPSLHRCRPRFLSVVLIGSKHCHLQEIASAWWWALHASACRLHPHRRCCQPCCFCLDCQHLSRPHVPRLALAWFRRQGRHTAGGAQRCSLLTDPLQGLPPMPRRLRAHRNRTLPCPVQRRHAPPPHAPAPAARIHPPGAGGSKGGAQWSPVQRAFLGSLMPTPCAKGFASPLLDAALRHQACTVCVRDSTRKPADGICNRLHR